MSTAAPASTLTTLAGFRRERPNWRLERSWTRHRFRLGSHLETQHALIELDKPLPPDALPGRLTFVFSLLNAGSCGVRAVPPSRRHGPSVSPKILTAHLPATGWKARLRSLIFATLFAIEC